jgi:ribosome biogenesis protein ENP2
LFTSIEPQSEINSFSNVQDSGVYLVAQEHPRIGIYFIPQLDPAPKWCPFMENITEELEEQDTHIVYDDFKFLTLTQLEELEASNMIDTKYVKQYMHGFLMHVKLYNKLAEEKGSMIFSS